MKMTVYHLTIILFLSTLASRHFFTLTWLFIIPIGHKVDETDVPSKITQSVLLLCKVKLLLKVVLVFTS